MNTSITAAVSIIVPTFNRARFLPATLNSLLAQSQAPLELIVVNDGCSDDTETVLQTYQDRIVYLAQANGGKSSAINTALRIARGRYIWVFDDDDLACPDSLARHVAVLDRRPEVGYTISGSFRCRCAADSGELTVVRAQPVRPFAADDDLLELLLSSYIAGPSTMIRAALIERVGRYREDLVRVDDFEMALRLAVVSRPGRLDTPAPSYYRRWHPGPRGRLGVQFAYAESIARSRAEERMVMRDLAHTLPPQVYLPRAEWQATLDDNARCRAHLRCWTVAVQKGMWPEAAVEFAALHELSAQLARLPASELAWACRAFSDVHTLAEMHATPAALDELAHMLCAPWAGPLRQAAQRQLYYHLRAAMRERDPGRLRLALAMAWSWFGVRKTRRLRALH